MFCCNKKKSFKNRCFVVVVAAAAAAAAAVVANVVLAKLVKASSLERTVSKRNLASPECSFTVVRST